jgi:hypothetical protein
MLGWVGLGFKAKSANRPVCRPGGLLDSTRLGGRAAGIRLIVLK